jgi:DNA replication protein DnaC
VGDYLARFKQYADEVSVGERDEAQARGLLVADLPATRVKEEAQEKADKLRTQVEIDGEVRVMLSGRLNDMTFATFEPLTEEQEEAKAGCKAWAEAYVLAACLSKPRPTEGLWLMGRNGRGKTHLAVGILRAITSPRVKIRFINVPEFLAEMKASFSEGPGSNANVLLDKCKTADVLVMDDLGQERSTEWVIDTLGAMVFHRHREALPIIITTNLSADEVFARADGKENAAGANLGAIYSRLRESMMGNTFFLDGDDYRAIG